MKYTDIIQSVERQILDGLLKPGSKLPSIRALTESYSCSKNILLHDHHSYQVTLLLISPSMWKINRLFQSNLFSLSTDSDK